MDVSLPSYEAAMRDAGAFLRRRDMGSHEEIPLYFAWERLYAAANANLSVDFVRESRAELRARKQARLAPRRGLPPPLFTSFDKVNRSSTQASAFLRSATPSAAAIDMMARQYRRDAKKLRSSRLKSVDSPPLSPVKSVGTRSKRSKPRQKGHDAPVRDLQEALEHANASVKGGFDDMLRLSEDDRVAAKMAATRPSSRAKNVYLASPELSPVAKVAAFSAQVSDWDAMSNLVAMTSSSAKGKGDEDELEKQRTRKATPVENGEGDTTFDTSPESSLLEGENDAANEQKGAVKVGGIGTFQALGDIVGGSENELNESEVAEARRRSRQQSTDSKDRLSSADRSEERRRSRLNPSGEPNGEGDWRRRPSVVMEDGVDEGVSGDETSIGQTADRGVEPQRKDKQSVLEDRASSSHNQRELQSGTTVGSEPKRKVEFGVGGDGVAGTPQTTQRQQQQSVKARLGPLIAPNTANGATKSGQNSGFSDRLSSSHAAGDMQVKVEGRKIVITFEGALDASTEEEEEEEEDMADCSPSGIFEAEQQQPVTRTVDSIMGHAEEEGVPPDSQGWSQVRNQVRDKELRKHRTEVLAAAVKDDSSAGESGERIVNELKSRSASQSERRESRAPAVERDAEDREARSESQRQQGGTRWDANNDRHASSVDGEAQESRVHRTKASARDGSTEEFEEDERKSVLQAVNIAREGSDNEEEATEEIPRGSQRWSQVQEHVRGKELRTHRDPTAASRDHGFGENGVRFVEDHTTFQSERLESRVLTVERDELEQEEPSESSRSGGSRSSRGGVASQDAIRGGHRGAKVDDTAFEEETETQTHARAPVHQVKPDLQQQPVSQNTRRNARNDHRASHAEGENQDSRVHRTKARVYEDSAEDFEEEEEQSVPQGVSNTREDSDVDEEEEEADGSPRGSQRWSQVRNHVRNQGLPKSHRPNSEAKRRVPTTGRDVEERDVRSESSRSQESRGSRVRGASRHLSTKADRFEGEVDGHRSRSLQQQQGRVPVDEQEEEQQQPSKKRQPRVETVDKDSQARDMHAPRSSRSRSESAYWDAHASTASKPQVEEILDDFGSESEQSNELANGRHLRASSNHRTDRERSQRLDNQSRSARTRGEERLRSRHTRNLEEFDGQDDDSDGEIGKPRVSSERERRRVTIRPQEHQSERETWRQSTARAAARERGSDYSPASHDRRSSRGRSKDSRRVLRSHNQREVTLGSEEDSDSDSDVAERMQQQRQQSSSRHRPSHSSQVAIKGKQRGFDQSGDSYSDYESRDDLKKAARHSKRFDRGMYRKLKTQRPESIPAMKYPPEKSQEVHEKERHRRPKRESAGSGHFKPPKELLEGIVWPPGMEDECLARLGLDGHHPMAPPGLEHLVTEEQWGEYWTWLHWYSSWQMWYMKNGKKPSRKSKVAGQESSRRSAAANWWVDVKSSK